MRTGIVATLCALALCGHGVNSQVSSKSVVLSAEKFNNYEAAKSFCSNKGMELFSIENSQDYKILNEALKNDPNYSGASAAFINGQREADNVWYSYTPNKKKAYIDLHWSVKRDLFEPYLTVERLGSEFNFVLAPKHGEKTWGAACQPRTVIPKKVVLSAEKFNNFDAAKSFCSNKGMELFSIENSQDYKILNEALKNDPNYSGASAAFINGQREADNVWYSYTPNKKKTYIDLHWSVKRDLFEPYLTVERLGSEFNFVLAPQHGEKTWGAACQSRAT